MKQWIKKIFGFGLASFLSDFSHEMTISLVPILVTQFVGIAQAPLFLGIIASVTEAFASFLRIVSGVLSDRLLHKKPLIALGYGISAIFATMIGFAHSVWGILVYRMLAFTGSGLREPPRDAVIAATVDPQNYGRAFGLRNAMDTFGSLVGPLVAFICAPFVPMRTIFILSFIPGILAMFAIIFLTQDVPPITTHLMKNRRQLWSDFAALPRLFIVFIGILFVLDIGNINKLLLIARAQEILVVNPQEVTRLLVLLYALFNLTRACSELAIGWLSDYISRITLLALLGCGILSIVAILAMVPQASLLYCSGLFVLAGISTATTTTLKRACAADMLPVHIQGLGYGVLQASEGIASLVANAFIGLLWTYYSPILGFLYVAMMSTLAMLLLLFF